MSEVLREDKNPKSSKESTFDFTFSSFTAVQYNHLLKTKESPQKSPFALKSIQNVHFFF